jgi:serine/threonine-protein kinase
LLGSVIDGRYKVLRQLGAGGMGAVYEAQHVGTSRKVALKVILNAQLAGNEAVLRRFEQEARVAGAIETQHTVQVLDSGTCATTKQPYIAMELLHGDDLQGLIRRIGPLRPSLALALVGQACAGLAKAHEAGVIHRDIKPANLFLSEREDGETIVKMLDFGIAKAKAELFGNEAAESDKGLTRTGTMLGSPLYMSPEQAMGLKTIDHRADIWSLGAVLYEALTGRAPHADVDTLGLLIVRICSHPPPRVEESAPWVPRDVTAIVRGAMERDPAQRFPTAAAMREAIVSLLPGGLSVRTSALTAAAPLVDQPPQPEVPSALVAPAPARSAAWSSGSAAVGGVSSSAAGVSNTRVPSGPRRALPVAGALIAVGAVAVAWTIARERDAGNVITETKVAAHSAEPTAAPQAPSSAVPVPATASATVERSLRISTVPQTASVEVDGEPVVVVEGVILLRGRIGSAHRISASDAKGAVEAEVTITAEGLSAPVLHLDTTKASAHAKPGQRR